jgi:hypothetical protein
MVWLGSFVCESCSIAHLNLPHGCQSRSYSKNIFKEHWDDYQLRSVQLGGNQALFEVLKEFNVQDLEMHKKYNSSAVNWYKRKHIAEMDGIEFTEPKPPKNAKETLDYMTNAADSKLDKVDAFLEDFAVKSVNFSVVIDQKGKEVIGKLKQKPWA